MNRPKFGIFNEQKQQRLKSNHTRKGRIIAKELSKFSNKTCNTSDSLA